MTKPLEFDLIITPDGETYRFNNKIDKFVWGVTGQAMPPIDYITQRGPFQDGESVLGYRLDPRIVQLVHRKNSCSRTEYWDNRSSLLDFLRPNRQTTTTFQTFILRKILPDGSKRDLNVVYQDGIGFRGQELGKWDEFSIQEPIRFIAHDPIFFDPDENITSYATGVSDDELAFPITFPIEFGISAEVEALSIAYEGTYRSFPQIILIGSMTDPRIRNITTGQEIALDYTITTPRTVTINLAFGNKSVEDDLGNNLIGTLTSDSDLVSFAIEPNPLADGGVNSIGISASDTDANAEVIIRYFTKYIGI